MRKGSHSLEGGERIKRMARLKWEKMVTDDGDLDYQKIAKEIWDRLHESEYFAVDKGFLIDVIDEIFEKGKEAGKPKKRGK